MILSISLPLSLSLSLFLFMPSTRADVDIFRDSPLRYAGYLNEVGEAFRPLVPEFVVYLSYVAALSYVFADTASKGKAAAELQTGDFGCGQAAVFEFDFARRLPVGPASPNYRQQPHVRRDQRSCLQLRPCVQTHVGQTEKEGVGGQVCA